MLLSFASVGKGRGNSAESPLKLSGTYGLLHKQNLKSKRSSLGSPAINCHEALT